MPTDNDGITHNLAKFTHNFLVRPVSYSATVHDVLTREYGPLRNAGKILARKVGVSARTAENWLHGLCAPRGDELIRLMAQCDALKIEIDRLVEESKKL